MGLNCRLRYYDMSNSNNASTGDKSTETSPGATRDYNQHTPTARFDDILRKCEC